MQALCALLRTRRFFLLVGNEYPPYHCLMQ